MSVDAPTILIRKLLRHAVAIEVQHTYIHINSMQVLLCGYRFCCVDYKNQRFGNIKLLKHCHQKTKIRSTIKISINLENR